MPNLWINVSSSYMWTGEVTGIVRTEIEVVKYILANKDMSYLPVRLFIFKDAKFIPIEERQYLEKISLERRQLTRTVMSGSGTNVAPTIPTTETLPSYLNVVSKKDALKLLVQAINSLIPAKLRPYFRKFILPIKSCFFKRLYKQKYEYTELNISRDKDELSSFFCKGDALLSLGLDWDSKIYEIFWRIK